MKVWTKIILEWINCLDVFETEVKDLEKLNDGQFYKTLIELFGWQGANGVLDTENILVKFLQDEYPEYAFSEKDLEEMEHICITSLFLLHASKLPLFHHPMCTKLQHETQLKIKSFLEMIIPHGKAINRETVKEIIADMESDVLKTPIKPATPITPKTKIFKDFFTSPATWSAQGHKLLNERNRELRMLKADLEVEKFEKTDLQEDLRMQQNKIQKLQKILEEKTAKIKALQEEKMNPNTPQSCKKNNYAIDYERYYKREIDLLQDQLMQKQCEIDRIGTDYDIVTKKMKCIEKQCIYFKEKAHSCEKSLENMQIQGEIKDRELINLRTTNEELHTYLKELRKSIAGEQSFEIDEIVPLHSLSISLNNSELLSSVIEIQLQEAKEESALLKKQLDVLNKKLESTSQEYENTAQLLKEKTQVLQNTEAELNARINNLTKDITSLQEKQETLITENKNLKVLCTSQKESLSEAEKSRNVLSTEINTLEETIKNLEQSSASQKESLLQAEKSKNILNTEINTLRNKITNLEESVHNENINNIKLNVKLTEVKSQMNENLKCIEDLTHENNVHKTSVDLYNTNLKEIILNNLEGDCNENDNIDNKTTIDLIKHLQTILCNFNKKYTLKQTELETLNNAVDEAKLKIEDFQLQILKLKEKDEQNITEISKLKKSNIENTTNISKLITTIEQNSEEISYLKQIELQKQSLEKDTYEYKKEISTKNSLIQASAICIKALKENIQTFETEFYLMKQDVLNQINEYLKYNKETSKSILNAYEKLYASYTEEQLCKNQLKDELADNKKELKDSRNLNITLQNELTKIKETMDNIEAELISTKEKLTKSTHELEKLEETKEAYQKQHDDDKSENKRILLNLDSMNDKLKESQQEVCNMLDQLKFKDEKIGNLTEELTSLKLEKEHIMHLQTTEEAKMKNFIKELETKLLEKQSHLDQLNIEFKSKQERLDLVQGKFETLTKETITSEMKLKEVIINLQEVRANQDAVLKAQEKALKEKCLHLEQLRKELNQSKTMLCKQLEDEKLLCKNLQSTNSELQIQLYKQTKTIEELQEVLRKERDELNKNKEYCKVEDTKKLEVVEVCEILQRSINNLKSTVVEASTNNEKFYTDIVYDTQCANSDDKIENILNTLKTAIDEIHATRKLILHLSNENTNLNETLTNQKVVMDDYVRKCEEIKLLKTEIQELNNFEEKLIKQANTFMKHKESWKDCLKDIIMLRKDLDTSLHKLKQKWDKLMENSHSIFTMDKSVCDELNQIRTRKLHLENTLFNHYIYHFQNIKSLQTILWEKSLWSEQKLKDIYLNTKNDEQISLDISSDVFSDEKTIIDAEMHKNKIFQDDIVQLKNEIDDFSKSVISFEINYKFNQMMYRSESEKKLQLQVDKLTEDKNNLESKLDCARIRNAKLEGDIDGFKSNIEEVKATSLKEVENLKEELMQLKEKNSKLQEDNGKLSIRPKQEDVDNQLKEIHDKYKIKVDEIKQNMKTTYNEQITKLNKEQEQCIQERLETLQRKMEQQCRKQADELSKYKAHVAGMSSQLWSVGEKLLSEKKEKETLQKELTELKVKYQNWDKKILSSLEQRSSKHEKKDLLKQNKEDVLHKIAVVQEKTTYERRYSIRSIQTMGNAFNAEDEEGEVFDNIYLADMKEGDASCSVDPDRISILKKRNALCKPHLKSSYPAEMQFHPLPFSEEEIKSGSTPDELFNDSLSQSLLPEQKAKKRDRTQTSYKKPGPPTPSKNGGRLSLQGNELRSPKSRMLRERNKERATATPRTLKSLFISRRQDESVVVTPRGRRRSSIFYKYRSANHR